MRHRAEITLALCAMFTASACGLNSERTGDLGSLEQGLTSVPSFGSNPGGLAMYLYAPAAPLHPAPLVVAMHGCTQTADDYTHAGWNTLADAHGFYVVYPQSSDMNECMLWYDSSSNVRDQGEALSVKQMVDYMRVHYTIDPARVFATGLSSGGAMTAVMLSVYPDVFAAGAAMSGVPYGCATNATQGYTCMSGVTKTAPTWGGFVRAADSSFHGPWPRMSVWQGTLDQVVSFTNSAEMVKQWTDVQGMGSVVGVSETVGPAEHTEYKDPGSGRTMVEAWAVQQMTHGVAIDSANGCGSPVPYVLDVQLCSSLWAAKFFGLLDTSQPDAGAPAGLDASMSSDAQSLVADSGTAAHDAAIVLGDGSISSKDAGAQAVDSGNAISPGGSGCGCGVAGSAATLTLLLPLALLALRRRRS